MPGADRRIDRAKAVDIPDSVTNVRGADRRHTLIEELGPARVQPAVQEGFDWIRRIRW